MNKNATSNPVIGLYCELNPVHTERVEWWFSGVSARTDARRVFTVRVAPCRDHISPFMHMECSHCPTRLNSTRLVLNMFRTPRLAKNWRISASWVEWDRKSVPTASGSGNTLTTRLNSTQLPVELSWVGSGSGDGALLDTRRRSRKSNLIWTWRYATRLEATRSEWTLTRSEWTLTIISLIWRVDARRRARCERDKCGYKYNAESSAIWVIL